MIKNYLLLAWRNARKHASLSLIQLLGLSVGFASCLLIFIYISHERNYDRFNQKADRIERVSFVMKAPERTTAVARVATPLLSTLATDYPEVEKVMWLRPFSAVVKHNQEIFSADNFYYSDASIFDVFDFDFVDGTPASLQQPQVVMLSAASCWHEIVRRQRQHTNHHRCCKRLS